MSIFQKHIELTKDYFLRVYEQTRSFPKYRFKYTATYVYIFQAKEYHNKNGYRNTMYFNRTKYNVRLYI